MSEAFTQAAADLKAFTTKPGNTELLECYSLYKQATEGDNTTAAPWAINLEAKAKWEAWTAKKGLSKEDASAKYVEYVNSLKPKHA